MNETNKAATYPEGLLTQAKQLYQEGDYQSSSELCTQALMNSALPNRDRIDWLSLRARCYQGLAASEEHATDLSSINHLVAEALIEREAELAVINRVQEGLSEKQDLQAIYDLVGEEIRQIFDAQVVTIYGFNLETHIQNLYYVYEKGVRYYPAPVDYSGKPIVETITEQSHTHRVAIINEGVAEYMAEQGLRTVEDTEPPLSVIVVPVTEIDNISVAITLQNVDRENAFTEADARLLETLGHGMSQALDNAALFAETQRRNAELAVINRIQQGLVAELDLPAIYELVGEEIRAIFDAQVVTIYGFDLESHIFEAYYLLEKGKRYYTIPRRRGGQQFVEDMRDMAQNRQVSVVNRDVDGYMESRGLQYADGTEPTKSFTEMPVTVIDNNVIVISVENVDREDAFSSSDTSLLETIARSMRLALENAAHFAETQQRNAELAVINRIQEGLVAELDLQAIYDLVGEEIRNIFDAQVLTIYGFDLETHFQEFYYVFEKGMLFSLDRVQRGGQLFIDEMHEQAQNKQIVVVNSDVSGWMKARGLEIFDGTEQTKSFIAMPVTSIENKIIFITLQNVDREFAFSSSDARLLETVARSMRLALKNAVLFAETQQRNAELAIINRIQEGLAAQLDLQSIYDLIGNTIEEIFEAQMVAIAGVDLEKNLTIMYYLIEKGVRFYPEPAPISGLIQRMVDRREPFIVNTTVEFDALKAETVEGTEESKSGLFVPLMVGDELRGGISIQNVDREHAFSEVDLRLLSTIANSMSVALENARLFDESQQRNAELAIINRVQNGLVAQMDLQSIYELVGDTIQEIFDAQTVGIAGFGIEEEALQIYYLCEKGQRHYPIPGRLGRIARELISTKQAMKIDTIVQYDEMGISTLEGTEPSRSGIYVPLIVSDKVIGTLSIENIDYEYAFDDSDLRLMATISSSMSIALENARLFEQATRRASETTALAEVSRDISATLDLETVMSRIATSARDLLGAETSAIYLQDESGTGYRAISALGPIAEQIKADLIIPGEGILGDLIRNKKAEYVNNSAGDPRALHIPGTPTALRKERIMAAPMLAGETVGGMIAVWRQGGSPFADIELDFLTGLAQQAVVAIENARLFNEVERQKEYFKAIFDSSPVAIVSVDPKGRVVSWSPAAERLFGYSAAEAQGREVDSLLASHPDLYEQAVSYTHQLQETGLLQAKTVRTRKDGSLVEVEFHAKAVIAGSQAIGYIGIYHDISELESARREAERASQAKSTFLANMSHELRTPLNAIIGFTRIVRRKGQDLLPEKQIDNLDKVLVSADHLLGLINTILDIAKIEAGQMEVQATSFNLQTLIDVAVTTIQPLVKTPAVDLQIDIPSDLPKIYTDQEKLKQILINLLSNAAKFTHHGEIRVVARVPDDRLEISVSDTGIGIPTGSLEKVFDEFQQADTSTTRAYGGTGLGLSISRHFARLLGGEINISSEEGKCSQFTLVLPRCYGDTITSTTPHDPPKEFERIPGKEAILVIDDNTDTQDLLRENLLDAGYQVITAANGEEGLQQAREIKPYAITLDVMMPRKDGWQVLHELKTDPATQDIPVILLSIVDQKDMGYRLGAFDYLVKPVEEGALVAALGRFTRSAVPGAKLNLLIVDDDPNIANLIAQFLNPERYHVHGVEDGLAGLHAVSEQTPDIILLDLMMPRLNGFEFISQLRQDPRYKNLPIIVLTARLLTEADLEQLTESVSKVLYKDGIQQEKLMQELFDVLENLAAVEG